MSSTGFAVGSELSYPAVTAVVALSAAEVKHFLAVGGPRLRALLPAAHWVDPSGLSGDEWEKTLREVSPEIVVSGWRTPRLPTGIGSLRYVAHMCGSVRGLIPRELVEAGLRVTNWGGVAAPIVAEHALLLVLAALRSMPGWAAYARPGVTHEDKNGLGTRSLFGRGVAVHGFGQVARELLKLLRPFGVRVRVFSAGVPEEFIREHSAEPVASLAELAEGAEVFVTCEALTERTRHSIDAGVLDRLAEGAVFVNVGRGAVVDEAALASCAVSRGLRVACDVVEQEPLPLDAPLRRVPGLILSPHIAGPTLDSYPRCGEVAVENVKRYLGGEPLTNVVTLELYDRST